MWVVPPLGCGPEFYKKADGSWAMVVQSFNSSTQEAEAGRSLSLRPDLSTEQVPVQPGIHRETLSQTTTKTEESKKTV